MGALRKVAQAVVDGFNGTPSQEFILLLRNLEAALVNEPDWPELVRNYRNMIVDLDAEADQIRLISGRSDDFTKFDIILSKLRETKKIMFEALEKYDGC